MFKRTAFVLMAVAGVASTSPAAATELARYTFTGSQAFVAFQTSTSLTCTDASGAEYGGYALAFGSLRGAEQIQSSTGSPSFNGNGTYVQVDLYYNSCTNVFFSAAEGGISGGFAAPDKKLTSSSLTGSGTVQDFTTALQYPVSLDLQVVGVGDLTNTKSNSRTKTTATKQGPVTITHDHSANSNRAGELSGSMTIDGVTFPSVDAVYASLIANSTSSTRISK